MVRESREERWILAWGKLSMQGVIRLKGARFFANAEAYFWLEEVVHMKQRRHV